MQTWTGEKTFFNETITDETITKKKKKLLNIVEQVERWITTRTKVQSHKRESSSVIWIRITCAVMSIWQRSESFQNHQTNIESCESDPLDAMDMQNIAQLDQKNNFKKKFFFYFSLLKILDGLEY